MTEKILTHKPGPGGLFDSRALCGMDTNGGVLRMHVWDYDCAVCASLAGERRG